MKRRKEARERSGAMTAISESGDSDGIRTLASSSPSDQVSAVSSFARAQRAERGGKEERALLRACDED
ncbi:hypothetical protein TIFTF001_007961 [Ficus carica]|uniref:Uncharacterized protein n=1 Tax=Ficus carica TaxID=3494 RepID=A0AA87ZM59_FICCA|nr:hypothetical protein TIFTF001_007961 [Ficus carica]